MLRAGANPAEIDQASRNVQEERLPEVAEIQRFQAAPPRVILNDAWWARVVLQLAPLLLGADIARGRAGTLFRRFAFGVTDVSLRV